MKIQTILLLAWVAGVAQVKNRSRKLFETKKHCWGRANVQIEEPAKKKRKRKCTGNTILATIRTENHRNNLTKVQIETRRLNDLKNKKFPASKPIELSNKPELIPESFICASFSQSNIRFNYAPACLGHVLVALCYPKIL